MFGLRKCALLLKAPPSPFYAWRFDGFGAACLVTFLLVALSPAATLSQSSSIWLKHQIILDYISGSESSVDEESEETGFDELSDDVLYALERPLDLNSASLLELSLLPGVSMDQARDVVQWRENKGSFTSFDDLLSLNSWDLERVTVFSPYFLNPERLVSETTGKPIRGSPSTEESSLDALLRKIAPAEVEFLSGIRWAFPLSLGFQTSEDSAGDNGGAEYEGSAEDNESTGDNASREYIGSSARIHNHLRTDFKDLTFIFIQNKKMGESFGRPLKPGSNVMSAQYTPNKFLRTVVVGDFTVRSASPLFHRLSITRPLSSGVEKSFQGGAVETFSGARSTSASSSFRGIALTLGAGRVQSDFFATRRRLPSKALSKNGLMAPADLLSSYVNGNPKTIAEEFAGNEVIEQGLGYQFLSSKGRISLGVGGMFLHHQLSSSEGGIVFEKLSLAGLPVAWLSGAGFPLTDLSQHLLDSLNATETSVSSMVGDVGGHVILQTPGFLNGAVLSASTSFPLQRGVGEAHLRVSQMVTHVKWNISAAAGTQFSVSALHIPGSSVHPINGWGNRFPSKAGEVSLAMRLNHRFSSALGTWISIEQVKSHPCFTCQAQRELAYPSLQSQWNGGLTLQSLLPGSVRLRWSWVQKGPQEINGSESRRLSGSATVSWAPTEWLSSTFDLYLTRVTSSDSDSFADVQSAAPSSTILESIEPPSSAVNFRDKVSGKGFRMDQRLEIHLSHGLSLHLRSLMYSTEGKDVRMRTADLIVYGPGSNLALTGSGTHQAALLEWSSNFGWTFWANASSLRQLNVLWIGSGNERTLGPVRHYLSLQSRLRF